MISASTGDPASKFTRSALDRRLVLGVAWTAIAKWGGQLVSSGVLLILARLLSPGDFGILGMAWLLLNFINVVSEFGIGSAIIVMREMPTDQIRQLNALSVLLGVAGALVAVLASRPAAAFFHKPELISVIPVVGLNFILSGVRVVPQSILVRDLRFKAVSGSEAFGNIANALSGLLLAWLGMRYWALVAGSLIGTATQSLIVCIVSPCGFATPELGQIRGQLRYSRQLLVTRTSWYLYSNADFVVAGRVLGETALGIYNMAWNLANAPVERVVSLIFRVAPSVFSNVQHDYTELRRYLRVLTEGVALIGFPAGIGIALVADPLIQTLFDRRWAGLAMPLRLLALAAVVRCLASMPSQVLETLRDMRFVNAVSVLSLVAYPPCFWYASRWGGAGIAAAWLCLCPVLTIPIILRTLHKIGMSRREYVSTFGPAGIAAATMTGVVLAVRPWLGGSRPMFGLAAESTLGAATYLGVLFVFFRPRVDAFLGLVWRHKASAGQS